MSGNIRATKSSGDIFRDLGYGRAESEKLRLKALLMDEIDDYIKTHKLTQAQAAVRFGVSRPRVSDATRGQLDKFTIDALVDMLARVGKRVQLKVKTAA